MQTPADRPQTRPSEQLVRAFLAAVPDPIFRMSRDGIYLDYSAPAETRLLASPDEFLGRHVSDVLAPEHARECMEAIGRALSTGSIQTYEYRLPDPDGVRTYEVRMAPWSADEVISIVRNVTDQRRFEAELRQSQQKLALHLEQTALGVIEWGMDFTIVQWNDGAERIFGYTRQQAIGSRGHEILVPPTARPHVQDVWDQLIAQSGGTRSTNENLTADGRIIVCEWFNTPLVDASGNVVGVASMVQDITERVQSELQIRQSQENYESLVNTIDGIVWEADAHSMAFTLVSQQIKRILGYSPSAWLQDPAVFHRQVHPDDRTRVISSRRSAAAAPGEHRLEYRVLRPDGSIVWLQDSITVLADKTAPGRPAKLRGIMVDITDRKRAEAALQQSEARFRRVVDSNLIGIYFWDVTGKVLEANDAFLRMLGYTREELEAGRLNWRAATPPEFRYLADRAIEQMRHFGTSRPYSKEFVRRDGSRVPVLIGDTFLENSTDRGVGFVLDITERRIAEDRQALMLKELDHRVKNNMMAVLTLTEQCLRAQADGSLPPKAAVENLLLRLRALARTHQALAHNHWTGATLRTLVRHTLEAFRHGDPMAFSIEGEDTMLPPRLATVMAMALHELATNALKHGALSVPSGHISVRWETMRLPDVPRPMLRLVWHESGGPSVRPPTTHGFGLELIKGGLSYESHGRVDIAFDASGLRCEIHVGLDDPDPTPAHQVIARQASVEPPPAR